MPGSGYKKGLSPSGDGPFPIEYDVKRRLLLHLGDEPHTAGVAAALKLR